MIIECMIGSVGYSDIPSDPLEEMFNNIKWQKMDRTKLELDGFSSSSDDEDDSDRI